MIHECEYDETSLVITECGCQLLKCKVCGVLNSILKCDGHKNIEPVDPARYYLDDGDGMTKDRMLNNLAAWDELETARREMDCAFDFSDVLEIGAGVGRYIPYFRIHGGEDYLAFEPDKWAADFILNGYGAYVVNQKFEDYTFNHKYKLVCAFHVFEHLQNTKESLQKAVDILARNGRLLILVPDDKDLCNPDHYWFFNEQGLRLWFKELGLSDIRACTRTIVPKENYIYITGVKR